METRKPRTTHNLRKMKQKGEKIAMITAYDYPSAKLSEQAGADIVFVGDSLGMVVLGYDSTVPVTMADMVHHTKAAVRGARNSFVLSDLPFATYHGSVEQTVANAARLMQEGGAQAVKMEGGQEIVPMVTGCVQAGIPVMGHIGLTPQSVHQFGGYRVQGRNLEQARKLLDDAQALEQAGAFAIVLEMVPQELGAWISSQLHIPTIGIGAGSGCDGQVLVYHDMLKYASPLDARFVKAYANLGQQIVEAIGQYVSEVKSGAFPSEPYVFHMDPEIIGQLSSEKVEEESDV